MEINGKTLSIIFAVILIVGGILLVVFTRNHYTYNLENPNNQGNATYTQAYIDPPNLIQLPPYKKLYPSSKQPLNVNTGLPLSMFKGSPTMNTEYTPDLLWCKQHI